MESTPAEQNHSSVSIHVGNSGTLDILLNVCMLLERQTIQCAARRAHRNELHMHSQQCKRIPSLNEFQKKADIESKRVLSSHMHDMYKIFISSN